MSDPVKIPQLAIQVGKPPRTEETRATPDGAPDAIPASSSFASVLKAKAQTTNADPAQPGSRDATERVDATAELVAAMFADSGGLQRLPLTKAFPTARSGPGLPIAPDSAAVESRLPAVTDVGTDDQALTGLFADSAGAVTPSAPTPLAVDQSIAPPAAAMPPPTAPIAALPAPTLASAETSTRREISLSAAASGTASISLPAATGHSNPAVATANSADGGKFTLTADVQEAKTEFRPVHERMGAQTDGIGLQASSNPASSIPAPSVAGTEPQQVRVATPFNHQGWAQEVEQKLAWVVTNSRQQADLVLNPPELGRIEVSLVIKGDEVSASFASPHQAVREAIEESLVRLRENLAEAGVSLGQTHVGRDSSRDAPFAKPDANAAENRNLRHDAGLAVAPLSGNANAWQPTRGRGLVDIFA